MQQRKNVLKQQQSRHTYFRDIATNCDNIRRRQLLLHRTAKGSALDVGYANPQLDARIQKGSAR